MSTAEGTLSKSQKKRMKRNASKANNSNNNKKGESGAAGDKTILDPAAMTPHDRLRANVMKRGFERSAVDEAVEEMWNLGLPYDEFDAVLHFMQTRAALAKNNADNDNNNYAPEEDNSASTSSELFAPSAPTAPPLEDSPPEDDLPPDIPEEDEDLCVLPPPSVQPAEEPALVKKGKEPPNPTAQHMDLATKLDMVADFENLADGITALTEWVTKAAKPAEITEFCNARTTKALPIVIRRSILEPTSSVNVTNSIADLIGAILRSSGVSLPSLSASSKALALLLADARATASHSISVLPSIRESIVTTVSDTVVSSLSKAMEIGRYSSQEGVETIRRLEEEIDALASSLNVSGSGGVLELMTKRDCHKVAAEKYSTVMDILFVSTSSARRKDDDEDNDASGVGALYTDENKKTLLLSSLLGGEFETVLSKRLLYEATKSKLSETNFAAFAQKEKLIAQREAVRGDRMLAAIRMDELKMAMLRLEQEQAVLESSAAAIEEQISALDGSQSSASLEMEAELDELAKVAKMEDDARAVVDQLQLFESAVGGAVSQSFAQNSGDVARSAEKLESKMGIYLARMKNYFKSEADIIDFLRSRARALEDGLRGLEFEIEECTALGMTTNVTQMTKSLKKTLQNIRDDEAAIEALRGEAETMKSDLITRLDEYKATSAGSETNNMALSSLHVTVLNGIKAAIASIGLSERELNSCIESFGRNALAMAEGNDDYGDDYAQRTSSLLAESGDEGGLIISGEILPMQTTNGGVAHVSEPPVEPLSRDLPEATAVAPKLSWASSAAAPKKSVVTSLLDIQKEELSMKTNNDS